MKKLTVGVGVVAAVAVVAVPLVSLAAYFNAGQAVDIGVTQGINQNAYIAGGTVTVSAPVAGDLLAAGGTITVSSKVDGDIMVAGGTVIISGASAQDLRAVAGNLTVGSSLSGELAVAGAQVMVTPNTTVAKDSYIRGSAVTWNGNEAGNLDIAGNAVVIGGTVGGNLTIKAAKSVTIASGAVIKGNLDYTAPQEASIASGAQITGETVFNQQSAAPAAEHPLFWLGPFAALFTLGLLLKFLMILLAAYLIWYIFRNDAVAMMEGATRHFWKSLLRGFVFLVAVPVAVIIALVTVVGVVAGVIAALVYAALLVLAWPITVLVVSSLVMKLRTNLRWYHILLGAVIVEIVILIPFVGWLAYFIMWLVSFGALLAVIGRKFARQG